ncbi:MAG: hypothetical protein IT440_12165 [Phycisphaeraceae bacterium]|nr:hypothetical protein [Phycisphaeraceae bacterium]
MQKSLDIKIARILADPSCNDFIIADAKDADMAGGMASPGQSPEHHAREGKFRSLAEYRQLMRENVKQALVDIMLMSASSNEVLTIHERLFDNSPVTPAARANDTTDIWLAMGSQYAKVPSRPFRSATIDHIMCGKVQCEKQERCIGADIGLFSMTFNNDIDRDTASLESYKQFRVEAEAKGFRHFLEVFAPNACGNQCPPDMGRFLNDMIARSLAGVTGKGRPVFLKIPYSGPAAMEQLASYDRTLVPGILGGASGTTLDAFHQLWEAKKYGARAALYGRMINNSEHQLTFIQHLRWLADGHITDPAEGVRSYHASLEKVGVKPYRPLQDDLVSTLRGSSYGSTGGAAATKTAVTKPEAKSAAPVAPAPAASTSGSTSGGGEPDFKKMTPQQRVQWNLNRWKNVLG